ncbi:MAG: ABC transporter ATP-binding protein [Anaerolineae bacterium]
MPLLRINGLTHYFGGLRAVYDYHLDLVDGELRGLIGPNGAGKTTIFNLICGLYRPTEGEISLDGKSLVGLRPHQITSQGIGRTFQNLRLFNDLTVLDNVKIAQYSRIRYGLVDAFLRTGLYWKVEGEIEGRAYRLLEILGIERYADHLARNLPYGDQRRVEMARALAIEPKLLLLDEPTAGMSPAEMVEMMDLIQRVREEFKLTILLIEHRMRVVMGICELIQAIDFGELIAEGTPEEIRSDRKVIEAYLGEEVEA